MQDLNTGRRGLRARPQRKRTDITMAHASINASSLSFFLSGIWIFLAFRVQLTSSTESIQVKMKLYMSGINIRDMIGNIQQYNFQSVFI